MAMLFKKEAIGRNVQGTATHPSTTYSDGTSDVGIVYSALHQLQLHAGRHCIDLALRLSYPGGCDHDIVLS